MIGFSVFLCKEKIAIIKRKREKGHVNLSSSTLEGKKKTENGTKRLIFTAVSILLEIVFLLFLFTKVSEYATIIDWATRIVAIFLVLGLYSMDKTSSMKMPWIILMLAFPILGVSLYLLVGLNGSTKKMRARYEEIDKKLLPRRCRRRAFQQSRRCPRGRTGTAFPPNRDNGWCGRRWRAASGRG